uniref:Uncharacterized protein n=1 Tax=Anguilla anguilla TaxID=7936 RepID=A0A0E9UQ11_ANGAN
MLLFRVSLRLSCGGRLSSQGGLYHFQRQR